MIFPKLAVYTTMALDANPEQDFLGKMFMDLGLGKQFSRSVLHTHIQFVS